MSFVWRGLCFKNEEEANVYETYPSIPKEDILMTFENDLRKKGLLAKSAPRPPPQNFAKLLMDTYTKMPVENVKGSLAFNYCILEKLFPFIKPILAPFCIDSAPFKALNDELPPPKPFCGGRQSTNCPEQ